MLSLTDRLSTACPATGAELSQEELRTHALSAVLEKNARDGEIRYASIEQALRGNPECCQIADPRNSLGMESAFGTPSRYGLANQLTYDHYWIVNVRLRASSESDEYSRNVVLDRCGELLRRI
jgi:hypothetical protein